jgi:ubiquinol-cytochrome c reductase cytochrome c1 subunit
MKKIFALLLAATSLSAFGSGGAVHLEHANIQPDNLVSLQNGAKLFVNYCMGCHSLEHQRYERMANDLQIPNDIVIQNLMLGTEKIGDQMKIAMNKQDAAEWFGAPPPDLTLTARIRPGGPDWIYTYLKSFYRDETRPYGVNNVVFPSVGMPHVLEGLQGVQLAVFEDEPCADDAKRTCKKFSKLELLEQGQMTPEEYDTAARDIANFLTYVAEPMKAERREMGVYVLLFLLVLFALGYKLKKEYWKDVPH